MRGWMARATVAVALAAGSVPALACDAMKETHASATTTSPTAKSGEKAQKAEKTVKKADTKKESKQAVATAQSKS